MRSRWLAALVAGALLALAPSHAAAGARIVGKLTLRERDRRLTPAEVERQLGRRIGLALRNGGAVVPARLEGDGRFGAEVEPGDWRLEWLDVGDRQEVLATPLVIAAREGATACAGRIEVAFSDLASELGVSAAGVVRVEPGCDGSGSVPATASPAPEAFEPPFGFPEYAEGLRLEGFFVDQVPGARLSMTVPIRRPLAWMGNVVVVGGASRTFPNDGVTAAVDAFEAGAGFTPYWGAEVTGGLRWESGGGGGAPWAGVRLGPPAYAFLVRADFRDGVAWSFGLDITLFHLVGRFF